MHSFAHSIVTPERKGHIAYPAANMRTRQIFFNPLGSAEKINGILAVLFNARSHRKYIRVEDYIILVNANLLNQYFVAAFADLNSSFGTNRPGPVHQKPLL